VCTNPGPAISKGCFISITSPSLLVNVDLPILHTTCIKVVVNLKIVHLEVKQTIILIESRNVLNICPIYRASQILYMLSDHDVSIVFKSLPNVEVYHDVNKEAKSVQYGGCQSADMAEADPTQRLRTEV